MSYRLRPQGVKKRIVMTGKSMTEGAPWKHIIKFALPVLLGSFLQQLYNTVDAIIVGNFAVKGSLPAVGTTGTVTFFFLAIAIGFSAGNGVVIAQYFGAKDEKNMRICASSGILFIMLLGIVSTIFGLLLSKPIFKILLSVDENIVDMTILYFNIYAIGLVFQYGYNIISSILRAVGDSKATLYFLLISSVINVILDLLFVAVFNWGVAGAAVATVISQFGAVVSAYLYMVLKYPIFNFKLKDYKWDKSAVLKTVKIGIPISIQMVIVSVGLSVIQKAVNEFGETMTESFTVGQRIEQYINLPCNALQTTLATYTGQNIGAGRLDRVKKGAKQTFIISLLSTIVISSLIWVFSKQIALLFNISDEAMIYCIPHIQSIAFINIILALYIPIFGLFQGMDHSGFPAIVATCALGVRIAVTFIFRYTPFFGYSIIWWNGLFGFGIGFLVTWIFYFSGKWQKRPQ